MYYIFAIEMTQVSDGVKVELSCLLTDPVSTLSEATKKFNKAIKFSRKENISCGLFYGGTWLEVYAGGKINLEFKNYLNKNLKPTPNVSYKILDVGIWLFSTVE